MDIDEIRRLNLQALEKMHGPALAKRAGMSPTQFYNLRDGAKDSKTGKPRGMRKETAWKLEDAAQVPRGYLDIPHFSAKEKSPAPAYPEKDARLLSLFHQLNEVGKNEVLSFVEFKVNEQSDGTSHSPARKKA